MIFIITITLFFVILRVSTVNMLLAKIYDSDSIRNNQNSQSKTRFKTTLQNSSQLLLSLFFENYLLSLSVENYLIQRQKRHTLC